MVLQRKGASAEQASAREGAIRLIDNACACMPCRHDSTCSVAAAHGVHEACTPSP